MAGLSFYNIDYSGIPATLTRNFTAGGFMQATWADAATTPETAATVAKTVDGVVIDLLPGVSKAEDSDERRQLVPGSIMFSFNGKLFFDRAGTLYRDLDYSTGAATSCGTVDYVTGEVLISSYGAGSENPVAEPVILSCLSHVVKKATSFIRFRTPGAPIRPQSLTVRATTINGIEITASSTSTGAMSGANVKGKVDYETGIVALYFGQEINDNFPGPHRAEDWYSASARYDVSATSTPDWRVFRPLFVDANSVLYNVVTYSFLPLDADLLGINPVRLPSDGKVPIFKDGYVLVVHDTIYQTLSSGITAGQVVSLSRGDLAEVILRDQNGQLVDTALYTVTRTTGQITFANPLNLTGYVEPLIAEHRIEDMVLCTDAQITGELTLSRALLHDYTAANSYVSSALLFGDLQARVSKWFDQSSWTGAWSDTLIGSAATANYNAVNYPPVVTNSGALTERWALVFTSSSNFTIIGETVGTIGAGSITVNCAPINPVTGQPYFSIDYRGWGSGWASGNVLRFNTVGNVAPIWFARTTKQSTSAEQNDNFRVQIRGDAD